MLETQNQILHVKAGQYEISTTISYLLGVPIEFVDKAPKKKELYRELGKNKHARIIRSLCKIRTDIMRNYTQLCAELRGDKTKTILSMPELVSGEAVRLLTGV